MSVFFDLSVMFYAAGILIGIAGFLIIVLGIVGEYFEKRG